MSYLLFSFEGRIRRTPYWMCIIITTVAYYLLSYILGFGAGMERNIANMAAGKGFSFDLSFFLFLINVLLMIWISIALSVKRLHDIDKSGWWQLIYFVPLINILFGFYVGLMPTNPASNRFGNAQPK